MASGLFNIGKRTGLLLGLSAFWYGPLKNFQALKMPIVPIPRHHRGRVTPFNKIETSIPASLIANKIKDFNKLEWTEQLSVLVIDWETDADFRDRADYLREQHGKLLIRASLPHIREISTIVTTILGKPSGFLQDNIAICNSREFINGIVSGFPSSLYPSRPWLLGEYIAPFMSIEDLNYHLPVQSAESSGGSDTREFFLKSAIHGITLNVAIASIAGLELAEVHFGENPPISSTVMKKTIQFLMRTPSYENIPDSLMASGDEPLIELSRQRNFEYDSTQDIGREFRTAHKIWVRELKEEKEAKELAKFEHTLSKLGYITIGQLENIGLVTKDQAIALRQPPTKGGVRKTNAKDYTGREPRIPLS